LRHADIEHGDIGMVLRNKVHGLTAVVRFGDDFEIRLLLEEKLDAGSDNRVVVGEEDAPPSPDLCQSWNLDGRIPQRKSITPPGFATGRRNWKPVLSAHGHKIRWHSRKRKG
jgi:hypothetical protein